MRNFRILLIGFLLLMTFGCTQIGEHSWGVTVDSIKAAVKHGKFFVTASDMKESPIPEPEKGQIVLFGYLDYGGYYNNDRGKPSEPFNDVNAPMSWDISEANKYGDCFFSAVIDEQSGAIISARLYYQAVSGRNFEFEGDLRDKLNGSFGYIDKKNFAFSVSGPEWIDYRRSEEARPEKSDDSQTAVVMGNGDILTAANGATFPAKLYIGVKDIPKKYPVRKDGNGIITFGSGNLKVIRYQGQ